MKNIWFENEGDFAEIKLTEQFEKSKIQICAAVGQNCGTFDIYINGILAGDDIPKFELYTSSSVTHISFSTGTAAQGDFYVDNVITRSPR